MYLQCNNHFTNQEIELSKDELWDLFKVSYKHYQTEVINDRKIYNRYVNDLISYHLPVFTSDEEAIRKHFQNLFCVYELLTDRKDLVEKYFTKSTFEKTDFSKMLNEFNHVEVILKDSNGHLHPLTESKLNLSQILPIERISSLPLLTRILLKSSLTVH